MAKKNTIVESFCVRCGRPYPLDYFHKSKNPHHKNGVLPYCKECANEILREHLKTYGNLESALWFTCSELGIPFILKVYERLEDKIQNAKRKVDTKTYNYVGNYIVTMYSIRQNVDTWDTFCDTDIALGEVKTVQKSVEALKESMAELTLDWGNRDVEDLQLLEYMYGEYTSNLETMTTAQERLYRDLCLVELRKRQKDENDESTKEEQKQIIDLMHVLKIDDFKVEKEKTMIERMLESQIAMVENEEPAEHYRDLEKYCDFMGIKRYMYNHIIRPLKNVLIGSKEYSLKFEYDEIVEYSEEEDKINLEELVKNEQS